MNRQFLRASGALALSVLFAASTLPAVAGSATHTRPPSHGAPSSGQSHASGNAGGHASGGGPTHAQGHATYGYGYGGYGNYPYYPYYPYSSDWYYGPWWTLGSWWAWPGYWGDGWGYGWGYGWPGGGSPGGYYGEPRQGAEFIGPAIVQTAIQPKKARVILDGEPLGKASEFNGTWDSLELDPGSHLLVFEAPGYKTLEVGIDARPGRYYRIAYSLHQGEGKDPRSTPIPSPAPDSNAPSAAPAPAEVGARGGLPRGFLRVAVTPSDAAVYLDGEFLGRGDELERLHGAIPVAAGEHRIDVVRPGYRSGAERVTVSDGQPPAVLRVVLEREGGSGL
jgi:hypothetical protein